MKRMHTRLWSALLAWAALGCADQQPPPEQPSFERPGDVAFVCLGNDGDRSVALPFDARNEKSPCFFRSTTSDVFAMHALVTQTTRGEVAVVNLEKHKKLDARRDIPGYTFVPVGENPSAIVAVVPPRDPDADDHKYPGVVYVANFGSRDIYALDISTMIDLNAGESAVMQVVPVRALVEGVSERGGPFDMVVSPSGDALLVSVPELEAVLRMPIRNCVPPETECILTDQIQVIPMHESLNRTLATPAPPTEPEPYQLQCGDFMTVPPPPGAPPELPADLMTRKARPNALALDAFCADDASTCPRRLLVADASLPLIHVIDLNAFSAGMLADPASALLDPWVTGTTTSDVAVTPHVPRSLETRGDDTQYVYAIDSVDGTVLVMQDGVLLHPNGDSGQRFDRVPLGQITANSLGRPRAAAIDVATPGFDDAGNGDQYLTADQCSSRDDNQGHSRPRDLNGVFLSVITTDGTVLVVDVHDMELGAPPDTKPNDMVTPQPCRSCPAGDVPVLTRHHLRLDKTYEASSNNGAVALTAPTATARIQLQGRVYDVRSDGTTTNPALPELACLPCEPPLLQAFPSQVVGDAGQPMPTADASIITPDASFSDAGPNADGGPPEMDQNQACPPEAPALICGLGDPWIPIDLAWDLTYEGPIPLENGEFSGHKGQFRLPGASDNVSSTLEFISEIAFCDTGILGDDDVPAGTRGDAVVITSPLPNPDNYEKCEASTHPDDCPSRPGDPECSCFTKQELEDCTALRKAVDSDPEYLMRFAIRRAYQDYVVLEEQTIDEADDLSTSYKPVVKCMDGRLMEFQIRTHESFAVRGRTGSGFESPVVTSGPNARCVRDPDADPLLQARALLSDPSDPRPFRNRFFELTILPPRAGGKTAPGTQISLFPESSAGPVYYDSTPSTIDDPSVVPVELRYLDIEKRLFFIDNHQLGLVPIELQPMPAAPQGGAERYN